MKKELDYFTIEECYGAIRTGSRIWLCIWVAVLQRPHATVAFISDFRMKDEAALSIRYRMPYKRRL